MSSNFISMNEGIDLLHYGNVSLFPDFDTLHFCNYLKINFCKFCVTDLGVASPKRCNFAVCLYAKRRIGQTESDETLTKTMLLTAKHKTIAPLFDKNFWKMF